MNHLLEIDGAYLFEANHFVGIWGDEYVAKDVPPVFQFTIDELLFMHYGRVYRHHTEHIEHEIFVCVHNLPWWCCQNCDTIDSPHFKHVRDAYRLKDER